MGVWIGFRSLPVPFLAPPLQVIDPRGGGALRLPAEMMVALGLKFRPLGVFLDEK